MSQPTWLPCSPSMPQSLQVATPQPYLECSFQPRGWAALPTVALPYIIQLFGSAGPFNPFWAFLPSGLLASTQGSPLSLSPISSPHRVRLSLLVMSTLNSFKCLWLFGCSLPHIYNKPSFLSHLGTNMSSFYF